MLNPYLQTNMSTLLGVSLKSGDIGVELEIEGENLPRSVTGWVRKTEGSLRGKAGRVITPGEDAPDTPQEYVSNGPVLYTSLLGHLEKLCTRLVTQGSSVTLTPRASTHLHLNMAQETLETFVNFIVLFCVAEPTLLRICGPQRNGNLFCMPSYETGEFPEYMYRLEDALTIQNLEYVRQGWPQRGKYACLNVDPIRSFGSVEVRSFPNSINPAEIFEWATYLMRIRDMSRNVDRQALEQILERTYNEPFWFVDRIFGLNNIFQKCAPNHPSELIAYGVELAHELVKSSAFLYDFKGQKPKRLLKKNRFEPAAETLDEDF
jgi:hypothetical protein